MTVDVLTGSAVFIKKKVLNEKLYSRVTERLEKKQHKQNYEILSVTGKA